MRSLRTARDGLDERFPPSGRNPLVQRRIRLANHGQHQAFPTTGLTHNNLLRRPPEERIMDALEGGIEDSFALRTLFCSGTVVGTTLLVLDRR
jgi:hypothetical protein